MVHSSISFFTLKLTLFECFHENFSKRAIYDNDFFSFNNNSSFFRGVGKTDKSAVAIIEESVFPVVQVILVNDVTEFLPYVFQVLSLTLETREQGVQGPYMDLFPLLLQPVLWERQGR